MMTRAKLAIGGTLIGIAMVTATATPSLAQEPTSGGTPPAGQEATMPGMETGDAQMAEKMNEMMDQCLAMMEMMSMMMGMMGGDMEGMEGMEDMPATPAP